MDERRSLASFQEAVCLDPSGKAYAALGRAHGRRGELPDAIRFLRAAVRVNPQHATYHLVLGEMLSILGDIDQASAEFEASMNCADGEIVAPSDPFRALAALAELHTTRIDPSPQALDLCTRLITIDPERRRSYELFCLAADPTHETPEALLARLEGMMPSKARLDLLRLGLCQALVTVGRYADARPGLEREWTDHPDSALIAARLALVEDVLGDGERTRAHLQRATELARPERADREAWNAAVLHAWRTGDYPRVRALTREGSDRERSMKIPAPREPDGFAGRTVLMWMTSIRWARFARVLHDCGAQVLIECETPRRRLMRAVQHVKDAVVVHDEFPSFDDHEKAFQLVCALDWAWEAFTASTQACVSIPAEVTRMWRSRIVTYGRGLHVGVDWRSAGFGAERDPYTSPSLPLQRLLSLTEMPDVICHSLHTDVAGTRERVSSPGVRLTPLSDELGDWFDRAAAISALDLVVTADTEVAHLAGVLGKPTLLMLPVYPEWTWGDRDTPFEWYPGMRRFQQRRPGDWEPVVREVIEAAWEIAVANLTVAAE